MFKFRSLFSSCCTVQTNVRDTEEDFTTTTHGLKSESPTSPAKKPVYKETPKEKYISHEVSKISKLKLVSIEGALIPINTQFIINEAGLLKGGRGKKDGETYIGHSPSGKGSSINDIVLEDVSVGPQHCIIKYDNERRSYFLQDLGEGSGTFIKIEKELELKSGYIISFSDSHMLVHTRDTETNLPSDDDQKTLPSEKKGSISIKFLDGPKVDQVFRFRAEDAQVKLGRMNDCQIRFDDNNLSRYQCTFKYVNNSWHLIDGVKNKPSTNGTWLLVDNTVELLDQMIVKIGQTLFRIEIIYD